MPVTDSAVAHLYLLGHRYVAVIRIATGVPTLVVASWAAPAAPSARVAFAVLALATVWSAVYVRALLRGPGAAATLTDAVVLATLAASAPWSVPLDWLEHGRSWLLPFLSFACVGYQYYASRLLGGVAALLVLSGAIVGTAAALPARGSLDSLVTAAWSLVIALLARMLWELMLRGGRLADADAADAEAARAEQRAKARIRAARRAYDRTLHDTAATTLLWVGSGAEGISPALLAAQAERDLERLSWTSEPAMEVDLMQRLKAAIDLTAVRVELRGPRSLRLPSPVTVALADAAGEALVNVARHAEVGHCSVTVTSDGPGAGARVEVSDEGIGFDPAAVGPTRRGVRTSIVERVEEVGGRAAIRSRQGRGTTVSLEWPR
ncbi:sensor histidine kinase [Streptomyces sp. NPDC098789]|uniref:sensor histidine kinase n=1 Tax=Streptomyces sp. NPDC098789 TaxID=3366098 RepID=UPI003816F86B